MKNKIVNFFSLGFFLLQVRCMKAPEINNEFGPEVSADTVLREMELLPRKEKTSIEIGDFVESIRYNLIENLAPSVVQQQGLTIIDKTYNSEGYYIFKYQRQWKEFTAGKMKESHSVGDFRVPIQETKQKYLTNSIKNLSFDLFFAKDTTADEETAAEEPQGRTTFHNLKVISMEQPTPEIVVTDEKVCSKMPTLCKTSLKSKQISYDQVVWSGSSRKKYSIMSIYSDEVPYLASQLKFCIQVVVPYAQQKIAVLQCNEVRRIGISVSEKTP